MSDVFVTFLSSIIVLILNVKFLGYVTVAFSELIDMDGRAILD